MTKHLKQIVKRRKDDYAMNLYIDKCVQGRRVFIEEYTLVNVRKRLTKKCGKIVGCYVRPYWHPYVYAAFHIEFDDGTCGTYHAKDVTHITNHSKKK